VQGSVYNIQRFCMHDGPGIRTTVFFKGCPLRCRWCHNPEGQSARNEVSFHSSLCHHCFACREACPEQAIIDEPERRVDRDRCTLCLRCVEACPYGGLTTVGASLSLHSLLDEVQRDAVFYRRSGGGVTASGGEPLTQYQAVQELFALCHNLGIRTALDTCGYVPWKVMASIEPLVDLFLYDLKCASPEKHREWTGVGNDLILENLRRLCKTRGKHVRIRIPLIPGFNDDRAELSAMAALVSQLPVQMVDVLPYHSFAQAKYRALDMDYSLAGKDDLGHEEAERSAQLFRDLGKTVTVGG
jgi:pyruvate formate lyase activating enzyme